MINTLPAALEMAKRGLRVFPLIPGDKRPVKGTSWRTAATSDPLKIAQLWRANPGCNYGVACGDGVLVIDVDTPKGGMGSLVALEGDLPLTGTLVVKTPGGGYHVYLSGPSVANSVEKLGAGLDVRGEGGYVVGPGCHFADTDWEKGYTGDYVITDAAPLAAAPEWLISACGGKPEGRKTAPPISVDSVEDVVRAARFLTTTAPLAVSGQGGNTTTYQVAAAVMEMGVSKTVALELMAACWNPRCTPPWDIADLTRLTDNAARYMQKPVGADSCASHLARAQEAWGNAACLDADSFLEQETNEVYTEAFSLVLTDAEGLDMRAWIVRNLLMQNEVSVLTGPGGVGKSAFAIGAATHWANGWGYGIFDPVRPLKVVVYNAEDDRLEMVRRYYAACDAAKADPQETYKNIVLWSGRTNKEFRITEEDARGKLVLREADMAWLARTLRSHKADVFVIDPLASIHDFEENSNIDMGKVMRALTNLARMADCAILVCHHSPKSARAPGDVASVRGASSITNTARAVYTMFPPAEEEIQLYGLPDDAPQSMLRVDSAKQNYAQPFTRPLWLHRREYAVPKPKGADPALVPDMTYSLEVVDPRPAVVRESDETAIVLAVRNYMVDNGLYELSCYDAAKMLSAVDSRRWATVPGPLPFAGVRDRIQAALAKSVTLVTGEVLSIVPRPKKDGGVRLTIHIKR